ncbi:MAG: hypothetical protein RIS54_716 [Verrucomicrobiota bacterium]|jgi:hypothetical protein
MLFAPFAGESVCRRVPMPQPFASRTTPNVEPRYALDEAAWLWHPELDAERAGHVLFRLDVKVKQKEVVTLQVSADLVYALALDGALIARGPDTGDVPCWSASAYAITLQPGRRRLEALVWWARPPVAPVGRATFRGGFACAGMGQGGDRFTTGVAPWRVARLDAVKWGPALPGFYHVIGGAAQIDTSRLTPRAADWCRPHMVRPPMWTHDNGLVMPGWRLRPSQLPEQRHDWWRGGRVRAFLSRYSRAERVRFEREAAPEETKAWDALWRDGQELRLPAGYRATLLVDAEDYLCGYPRLQVAGGAGAEIGLQWTEALRENEKHDGPKGDRAVVAGKFFQGFGDSWRLDGKTRWLSAPWWRSGRYFRLDVRVGRKPLRLRAIGVDRTGYPLATHGRFRSSDAGWTPVVAMAERGLKACMHEVYVDCPFYEQMMYVADTRIQMLVNYVVARDDRLVRRGIELFDLSRGGNGFPTMRFPACDRQESATFAMIWPWMLRDYAWWRDDPAWVRERLPGLRAFLEALVGLADADGLLVHPPGWLFADWVTTWPHGWAPGTRDGRRSLLVNLHYLLALQAGAQVERAAGEPVLAERWSRLAAALARKLPRRFWSKARGLWADEERHESFSQHGQALAIIAGLRAPALSRWVSAAEAGIAAATIYFQHYVLEAIGQLGRGDLVLSAMAPWRRLVELDLKTPEENPDINRSECHAWGSHPLFHLHATIAGVRPAAPGFRRVRVVPSPGTLTSLDVVTPHPRGAVKLKAKFEGGRVEAEVTLPRGVAGEFVWGGKTRNLRGGTQRVRM